MRRELIDWLSSKHECNQVTNNNKLAYVLYRESILLYTIYVLYIHSNRNIHIGKTPLKTNTQLTPLYYYTSKKNQSYTAVPRHTLTHEFSRTTSVSKAHITDQQQQQQQQQQQ